MNRSHLLLAVCEYILAPTSDEARDAKCRMEDLMKRLKVEMPTTDDVDYAVHEALNEVGTPTSVKGYRYLHTAICIAVREPEAADKMTKYLYPTVADCHGTTASCAERALRHCVERAFEEMDDAVMRRYFGSTVRKKDGKVTNAEFITKMALVIRQKLGM